MANIIDQIDALEPGVVRIYRDSESDIGYREALVYLDGELAGSVDYKHVLEIEVRPGEHELYAYNRVFKTHRICFDVRPGERVNFQAANVAKGLFIFFMMLGMGIPRITLVRDRADALEAVARKVGRRQLL